MTIIDDILKRIRDSVNTLLNIHEETMRQRIFGIPDTTTKDKLSSDLGGELTRALPYNMPSKPLSPRDMWNTQKAEADSVQLSHLGVMAGLGALKGATLGVVDIDMPQFLQLPAMAAARNMATATYTSEFEAGIRPVLYRYVQALYKPNIPEPFRLTSMMAKGILDPQTYLNLMAEHGYADEWSIAWEAEQHQYPSFAQLIQLYWRGVLEDKDLHSWMRLQNYPEWVVNAMKAFKEVIPPLDDLIRMAVREAFGTHTSEEQMQYLKMWAKKQGLSEDWTEKYWWAHWQRMPLGQAYENLWRGNMTEDQFRAYLKIADLNPVDHDYLLKVAYRPLSMRELGYGYDVGTVTREMMIKHRRWGGLDLETATIAADSMIEYRVAAEKEAVRREYLWQFAHEKIDEGLFRLGLYNLNTPEEATELWVWRGILQRERYKLPEVSQEFRIITSSEALYAFKNKLRNEEWLRSTLATLLWTEDRITLAVERAKKEMAEEEKPKEAVTFRELGAAQLRDAYRKGYFTTEDVYEGFKLLNYRDADAMLLTQLIVESIAEEEEPKQLTIAEISRLYDMRVRSREEIYEAYKALNYTDKDAEDLTLYVVVNNELPDLRARYRNGWINEEQLLGRLIELGLDAERAIELAETVIVYEQPERVIKEKDLTKAEIIKGAKMEILTPEQAVELLMQLGYEEWEAWYILAINAVVEAGDPQGYWEMRRVVEYQRRALGQSWKQIPNELITFEKAIATKRQEIKKAETEKADAERIAELRGELGSLENEMRRLLQQHKLP